MAQELAEWRRAHPKATLTEIEGAVFGALQKLQAQALGEVVHASSTTDVAAQPTDERPRCPTCGGQLEPRGRQRRTVRPARQRAALNMDPIYTVCATCGAGLSPDEELGLLPGELSATLAEGGRGVEGAGGRPRGARDALCAALRRAVACRTFGGWVTVQFFQHGIVNITAERAFNGSQVRLVSVRGQLDAMGQPSRT